LIEEVARVYGYAQMPTEHKIEIQVAPVDSRQVLTRSIGTFLNACGFFETVTVKSLPCSQIPPSRRRWLFATAPEKARISCAQALSARCLPC